ncbi:MAG: alanine racemase [Candidatus Omnitrophica bacterium]|nr:alanine racemase [Candidatus Omnitrophota bacterium]
MNKHNNIGYRKTWAEINLKNLAHNFRQVKRIIAPSVKVMACVKADAYGHGIIAVAKKLVSCGVDYLGVASIDEGIKLRNAGVGKPILILGLVLKEDISPIVRYKLIPALCTMELAHALNRMASKIGKKIKVHVKVDTGMGRIGVLYKDTLFFIKKLSKLKFIEIEGMFTHFPSADTDRAFTLKQISLIKNLKLKLSNLGIEIPLVHAANSMGLIGYKESHFNMVRPGLMIYGLYPKQGLKIKLKPVLSLKTRVVYSKTLPAGYAISYGRTYLIKKNSVVVTLPIGYGDGYPRNLSNLGPVLIGGRRFKISGRVCMDQMMVDVGAFKVRAAELALLIGSQGKHRISAEELARLSGTIPYEITCGLGSRIPRVYLP